MVQNSLITYDQKTIVENAVATVIFIIPAALIAALAGAVAMVCVMKGGNLEWSTKFWVFVKVACKFNR